MSKQVHYSHISTPKAEFDRLYTASVTSADAERVQSTVQSMAELQDKIINALNAAPANVSRCFNWGTLTVDVKAITEEVERKLASVISHFTSLTTQSLNGRIDSVTASLVPLETQTPKNARALATGFGNLSANCWANSFLSMIVFVPNLKQAYQTVANYYAQKSVYDPARVHGIALQNALRAYDTALAQKQSVPSDVTQTVRLAFNHLFGIFSTSSANHEDAYEAMQMLMGRYEQIIREQNPQNPAFSDLYRTMETKRHYRPFGEQREADAGRVARDDYSKLNSDNSSSVACNDYQILLDMQNKSHLSFQALLTDYFRNTSVEGDDLTQYLLPNGKLQSFKLVGESRQFTQVPNEFTLTIKRFGAHGNGQGYKIMTPLSINRVIALPAEATRENKPIAYGLDAFIVHSGGLGGGHYISYKKIDGYWIEANDSNVRLVEANEIDQILHGQKSATFTSYLHHYSRVPVTELAEFIPRAGGFFTFNEPDSGPSSSNDRSSAILQQYNSPRGRLNLDHSEVTKSEESTRARYISTPGSPLPPPPAPLAKLLSTVKNFLFNLFPSFHRKANKTL
jgi:ubiquitin C-terminal hydrolase